MLNGHGAHCSMATDLSGGLIDGFLA
jgi:hypothetical protein